MSEELKCHLVCTEGGSDKEYIIHLLPEGDGFVFHTFHGARGKSLKLTVKTKEPVSYDVAKKAYDKTYKEKTGKGYQVIDAAGEMATPECPDKTPTGLLPQLLNPIEESEISQYILDPNWVMQEKHDGHRRAFALSDGSAVSANRKGFAVAYPKEVTDGIAKACSAFFPLTVDGELMGSDYVIFDLRVFKGESIEHLPVSARLELMEQLSNVLAIAGVTNVRVVKTARTSEEKRELFWRTKKLGREGIVGKRLDAPYVPGKPNSGGPHFKLKFVKDATVMVISRHATKSSIGMGMLDAAGKVVPVGNCTIPANATPPEVGSLVDVQYLYAYQGGSLYQPVYIGSRDDVSCDECTLSRLHFKPDSALDEIEDEAA
jgi:bifunctional non-homologous end joining protein LigD